MPLPPPPAADREDVVDVFHGVAVADPYRWMEDPADPRLRPWIDAQNARTEAYFAATPMLDSFRGRLTELWSQERRATPKISGAWRWQTRNSGLQNQSVLYRWHVDRPGDVRVVLDPNTFSADGTTALMDFTPSPDGSLLAYTTSVKGTDWRTLHVIDPGTGREVSPPLVDVRYSSTSWLADGSGLFYQRFPRPEAGAEYIAASTRGSIMFHRVGTPQADDVPVRTTPSDTEFQWAWASDDGRWLFVSRREATRDEQGLLVAPLAGGIPSAEAFVELVPLSGGGDISLVGNVGDRFFLTTTRGTPNGRVVAVDFRPTGMAQADWVELVPESRFPLEDVKLAGGRLVLHRLVDATSRLEVRHPDGSLAGEVSLPGLGDVSDIEAEPGHPVVGFQFSSLVQPPTLMELDVATLALAETWRTPAPINPADYEVRTEFATSADGTRIPLFLVQRAGLAWDGERPTLLYGYGGFNARQAASYRLTVLPWVEAGGAWVLVGLRGGSEYGKAWHDGGRLANKQNVFDDLYAAAAWVIDNGLTNPRRLAVEGRSNGGLLVGAAITQRPALWRAALCHVGVHDMLRYHQFTIGWGWASDYGRSDDPAMFPVLHAYSPLHNAHPAEYPATLLTTADFDDRVVPAHTYKFTAALQAAQRGGAPILLAVETRAGHGGGKPTSISIEERARYWAFLARELGMQEPAAR